jgi:hypothetical protein
MALANNPVITAAEDGIISGITITEGEKPALMPDEDGEITAMTLGAGGVRKLVISADELDITHLKVGQAARITVDAITGESFTAAVIHVSHIQSALAGTTGGYSVELELTADPRFLTGMNCNAIIMVDRVDNVLLIPVDLINEDEQGSYVFVSESGGTVANDRKRADIVTGLSDGVFAQVISGLSEGDKVVYTDNSFNFRAMMMGARAGNGAVTTTVG